MSCTDDRNKAPNHNSKTCLKNGGVSFDPKCAGCVEARKNAYRIAAKAS